MTNGPSFWSNQEKNRLTFYAPVAAELFQAIVSGTLQPDERIYEENVAHWLGVAKTNLREALQNLEYRGLVTKYLGGVAS